MNFVFWQNVVSIHQSAFIKALAKVNDVTLVAAEEIDAQRQREKWSVPSMGRANVIVSPSEQQISALLDMRNVYHVFSGINGFPMVYNAFKGAVARRLHVSIMLEPYEWAGIKGFLRRLMYVSLYLRYGKYIDHVFATGNMGVYCYRKAGFPKRKVHQWGYFTEQNNVKDVITHSCGNPKLIYVGRLDHNKNILSLLIRFNEYWNNIDCFTIVGDGPLMNDLQSIAKRNPKIKILGRIDNKDVCDVIANHDYLILPSLYDGWGAVVNESLSVGTPVLCSKACGASILLDGKYRGEAFSQENMIEVVLRHCKEGIVPLTRRRLIIDWAKNNISGEVAADYFFKVINKEDVSAPWIQ